MSGRPVRARVTAGPDAGPRDRVKRSGPPAEYTGSTWQPRGRPRRSRIAAPRKGALREKGGPHDADPMPALPAALAVRARRPAAQLPVLRRTARREPAVAMPNAGRPRRPPGGAGPLIAPR